MMDSEFFIKKLNLLPHPEGGWYKETYLSNFTIENRPSASMIYYLLKEKEISKWHKVTDADELWIWNYGEALELKYSNDGGLQKKIILGPNKNGDQFFQMVIPKGVWQSAKSLGEWSLVSCVVSPAFSFDGFEIAEKGWEPGK